MEAIERHKIRTFPNWYPWYKKLGAHITYYFSQIPLWRRKNLLTWKDISSVWKMIRHGDILLVWNFQHSSAFFIDGIVTHAIAYIWKWRCIHAYAHWVAYIWLRKVLRQYDSCIVVRPYWKNDNQKYNFHTHLIEKIGKPYDFFFGIADEQVTYFCTRLINDSLIESHYHTGLESVRKEGNILDQVLDKTYRAHRVLTPEQMLKGNFQVIITSKNIIQDINWYRLRDGKLNTILSQKG